MTQDYAYTFSGPLSELIQRTHTRTQEFYTARRFSVFWFHHGFHITARSLAISIGSLILLGVLGASLGHIPNQNSAALQAPLDLLDIRNGLFWLSIMLIALSCARLFSSKSSQDYTVSTHQLPTLLTALHNIDWNPEYPMTLSMNGLPGALSFDLRGALRSGHTLNIRYASRAEMTSFREERQHSLYVTLKPNHDQPNPPAIPQKDVLYALRNNPAITSRAVELGHIESIGAPADMFHQHAWTVHFTAPRLANDFFAPQLAPALDAAFRFSPAILTKSTSTQPPIDPSSIPLFDPIHAIQPTESLRKAPYALVYALLSLCALCSLSATTPSYFQHHPSSLSLVSTSLSALCLFFFVATASLHTHDPKTHNTGLTSTPTPTNPHTFSLFGYTSQPTSIPLPSITPSHLKRLKFTSLALITLTISLYILPDLFPKGPVQRFFFGLAEVPGPTLTGALILYVASRPRLVRLLHSANTQRSIPYTQKTKGPRGTLHLQTSPPSITWSILDPADPTKTQETTTPFTPTDLSIQLSQPLSNTSTPSATLTLQPLQPGSEPLRLQLPASLWPQSAIPTNLPHLDQPSLTLPDNQRTDFLQTLHDIAQAQAVPLPHHLPTPQNNQHAKTFHP